MQLFSICSTLGVIWLLRKIIDTLGGVPLRLGKRQSQYRKAKSEFFTTWAVNLSIPLADNQLQLTATACVTFPIMTPAFISCLLL
jgi:hypothetical protein